MSRFCEQKSSTERRFTISEGLGESEREEGERERERH